MSPEKPQSRSRRLPIEREEEKAWISFYQRVGNNLALASEVLVQLDSDPEMKRIHLALYLCCKESIREYAARQARNRRIGQSVRRLCRGLFVQPFAKGTNAMRTQLRSGAEIAVACLPEVSTEPAIARVGELTREPALAAAQTAFQNQRTGAAPDPAATTDDEAPATASRKAG